MSNPTHGSVTVNANGGFTYTPSANYNGADSFTYKTNDGTADSNVATVNLTVTAVNDAPVALGDSASTSEDTPVLVDVLGNDTDVDNSASQLSVELASVTSPAHGTAVLVTSPADPAYGKIRYTPAADYNGSDSFTYVATDGSADSGQATVSLTVTAVNDAPVAVADSATTAEDNAATVDVLANDTDVDNTAAQLSVKAGSLTSPGHGTAMLVTSGPDAGKVVYTPSSDYNGSDSFSYVATDGTADSVLTTVTLTVNPVNDVPTAASGLLTVQRNSSANGFTLSGTDVETALSDLTYQITVAPAHGTLSGSGANLSYTPAPGYSGADAVKYTVTDTGDRPGCTGATSACAAPRISSEATIGITVTAPATTTSVDDASATYGDSVVSLSATVTSASSVGTGAVTFSVKDGSTVVGSATTVPVASGLAVASYTLPGGTPAKSYTVTADYNGVSLADSSGSGTLDVTKKALTVTADADISDAAVDHFSKVYGSGNPVFTARIVGFEGTDGRSDLGGALAFDTDATATSNVGDYAVTPKGLTSGNYEISFVAATLTVGKAALELNADDKSKTYGEDNPSLSFSVVGLVNGDTKASALTADPTLDTAAVKSSNAGTYPITLTGGTSANYSLTRSNATLTVGKAALELNADDKSKTYGEDNPSLSFSVVGLVNGDTKASALTADPTLDTAAVKSSNAGTYPITLTGGTSANYSLTRSNATLTVGKAALELNADDKSKTYGEDNPSLSFSVVGLVNGDTKASALTADPTLDTAAVKSSNAGTYPITLTGGTSANYSLTRSNATLTVGKAALELNADDKSKTYGEDNPSLSFSVVGLVNGDTKASALTADPTLDTAAVKSSNAGTYPITLTGGTSANYSLTRSNATLTVGKAALELNADDKSKTYGEDNPSLSFSVVGLVNGDTKASALTADPTLDTAAVKSSNAGTYPITLTGGTSANYSLTRSNATLTVGKAALELNADDKSKTYGEDNPSLSFSVVGLVNGDTKASALTADPTLDTAAVKSSNAGTYPITLTGGTSANYSLTRSNATLTVGKAALELNADDQSKTYGEDNPSLSFSVVGLVNGDTKASALTADPTLDTAAVKSSHAGSYPITLTGGTSANYSLTRSTPR